MFISKEGMHRLDIEKKPRGLAVGLSLRGSVTQ